MPLSGKHMSLKSKTAAILSHVNMPIVLLALVLGSVGGGVGVALFNVQSTFGIAFAILTSLSIIGILAMSPGQKDDPQGSRAGKAALGASDRSPSGRGGGAEVWRAVIDAMPDAAIALSANGIILHHNALASEMFASVKTGQAVISVWRHPEFTEALEKALKATSPIVVHLFERVPLERRISAIITKLDRDKKNGTLPALLVTFRDLTEQDKLAQMRADFIANASHELRTPLASLRGFIDTLLGPAKEDPAARARFLDLMASQAMRMTRLIEDLLSLSRVEMHAHVPPRGVLDLNEVASYVVQTLEPLAQASEIVVSIERLPGHARIRGDREEIVQLLQNLAHNAIKYGHKAGTVALKISRIESQNNGFRLVVSVTDDGPGIAPEHLPRLTERFYRINVASSRDKGGTGLGLAIVKHIVNRHRADLKIESRLGQGSTFTVTFLEHEK